MNLGSFFIETGGINVKYANQNPSFPYCLAVNQQNGTVDGRWGVYGLYHLFFNCHCKNDADVSDDYILSLNQRGEYRRTPQHVKTKYPLFFITLKWFYMCTDKFWLF